MLHALGETLLTSPLPLPAPTRCGQSSGGRPIPVYQFGRGAFRISLLAGCHADEPAGPLLLRRLVAHLHRLPADHPLLTAYSWWIVPHANPDGESVNQVWYDDSDGPYDLARYLRYSERAVPRDDLEFGFPIGGIKGPKRPENEFIYDFWRSAGGPFQVHASLHSMPIGFGTWFLLDPDWQDRTGALREVCAQAATALSYPPHDLDRRGEKGFSRIAPGFATRPNHQAMQAYFIDREDSTTAGYFHPSSMESIRSLGGDCLTLVSEIPFFILPGDGSNGAWPHPVYEFWKNQLETWRAQLLLGRIDDATVNAEAQQLGLQAVPVRNQWRLQWVLVAAGVEAAGG